MPSRKHQPVTGNPSNAVLIRVERRVLIGEVVDGASGLHPVEVAFQIIGNTATGPFVNAEHSDADPDALTVVDAFAFEYGGHAFKVEIEPTR